MRRIPVIALIVLLLAQPIPALAQSATPATAPPVATTGNFPAWSTSGGAHSTWSAAAKAVPR